MLRGDPEVGVRMLGLRLSEKVIKHFQSILFQTKGVLRVLDVLHARCGTRREGWVFPSKRSTSGHLTSICNLFRQARKEAGLPKELVLYCARHDYGTRVLMRTGNLAAVMRTMGHGDVKTAMHYQHPELEIVRAALDYNVDPAG
jgi:site-specific recombinase XerD